MRPVFKEYLQGQGTLFPERFDDYIPKDHPVRLVSAIVDRLDITPILKTYKGGGTSSYHPRMLLKVLFYAYLTNIFSSRKIEKALRENIYFMWLSGKQFPDFRTINNFRSKRLKGHIQKLFSSIVLMMAEAGAVDIKKEIYTDGTKIEANANRYSFVWRKRVEKSKDKLERQLKEILKEIESEIKRDNAYENKDKVEDDKIDRDSLLKKVEALNKELRKSENLSKKSKQKIENKLKKIKTESLPRLSRYEQQLEVMGSDRNSYSKTDTDATFMRMKEDHMKNGQLKPAYNIQISTQQQFLLHYSIHQNRTDTNTYKKHLKGYKSSYNTYPGTAVADASYGSEENYAFLESNSIESYVKYNWFDKEQKSKFKKDLSRVENLYYNEEEDYFVCPMGQKMYRKRTYIEKTPSGYRQEKRVYAAQNCKGCPVRGLCHKSIRNRELQVSIKLRKYKEKVKAYLLSESGIKYRKQRSVDVETVFGQIKQNKGFRRFLLRGLEKVNIEFGLVAIAHNLQKFWLWLLKMGYKIDKIALLSVKFLFFAIFTTKFCKKLKESLIQNFFFFKTRIAANY